MTTEAEVLEFIKQAKTNGTVKASTLHDALSQVIEHFGVKGQKWGVRRKSRSGGGKPSGPDISKLSDHELRTVVSRMQLEKQYNDLAKANNKGLGAEGSAFAKSLMREVGKEHAKKVIIKSVGALGTALFVAKKLND